MRRLRDSLPGGLQSLVNRARVFREVPHAIQGVFYLLGSAVENVHRPDLSHSRLKERFKSEAFCRCATRLGGMFVREIEYDEIYAVVIGALQRGPFSLRQHTHRAPPRMEF